MVPDAKVAGGAGIQLDFFRTAASTGATAELNPVPAGKVVGEFVMSYYEALKSNQSALQSAYVRGQRCRAQTQHCATANAAPPPPPLHSAIRAS